MDIKKLIKHPELMNKETLYELRSLLALYPYFQTVRLLMLQNLYILHDQSFDEELRKAALFINDRRVIFNLVEAAHYRLGASAEQKVDVKGGNDRMLSLIDTFLEGAPKDETDTCTRKPTPADAAVDYVAYLLDTQSEKDGKLETVPKMKGQNLIDSFINNDNGKIILKDEVEYVPQIVNERSNLGDEGYFTETLAKIYIKQERYSKAIEIIKRLYLNYPKKNVYFADQLRYLEKLELNNKNNK